MNNVFRLNRFGWLMKKTLLERPEQLIGLTGLSFLLSLLIYGIVMFLMGIEDAQNASFLTGLVGGGCFLASFVYGYFGSNASGSSYLTLPASQFEKWLTGILLTGVVYLALFLLFFRLIDIGFIFLYHRNLDPNGPYYKELYTAVRVLAFDQFIAQKGFMMFFNFTGIMLVGSLFHNKSAFIKVALLACSVCLGAFLLNLVIARILIGNVQTAFPFYLVWIMVGTERARLELPPGTLKIVNNIFQYALPAILWGLAYLRLKEKEF